MGRGSSTAPAQAGQKDVQSAPTIAETIQPSSEGPQAAIAPAAADGALNLPTPTIKASDDSEPIVQVERLAVDRKSVV